MDKKNQRKPTLENAKLKQLLKLSDKEKFYDRLYFRSVDLLRYYSQEKIPKEVVAFETIQSISQAMEGGLTHEEMLDSYPVKCWKEDTVTLPKALLRPIVEAWIAYKAAPSGKTLGECLNVEGGGQGKPPFKKKLEKINRDTNLANEVVLEYLVATSVSKRISWEEAINRVAHNKEISSSTVNNAFEPRKRLIIDRLASRGILKA